MRILKSKLIVWFIALVLVSLTTGASAYKLSPSGTEFERVVADKYTTSWNRAMSWVAQKGVLHFTESVHEEITHRIYGCKGDEEVCGNTDIGFASPYVLAGVRWNDDPPFRLSAGQAKNTKCKTNETIRFTTQPRCWAILFLDAQSKAEAGLEINADTQMSLLARSHFGDLQFLHAMAESDGEPAYVTKSRIMMWAEFTWRVATGEFTKSKKLAEINTPGFGEFFGRSGWRVQELFTLGNPTLRRPARIRDVAFGSILHTVQDSFAAAHAHRLEGTDEECAGASGKVSPGIVSEFHSYGNQDGKRHAKMDTREAFDRHMVTESEDVVEVGQNLLRAYEKNLTWEEIKPYFECVFQLDSPDKPASPGHRFI